MTAVYEPFDPDGHLSQAALDDLAEVVAQANRDRILAWAVAPWWLRLWWRITRGGPE